MSIFAKCVHNYISSQVGVGSGWFIEPYKESRSRTLVTYIGDVSFMYSGSLNIHK